MIALRRQIERGIRHPVLGPFCLLLLALLLAFTVIHATHDQIHSHELVICVAFLLGALVSLALPRVRDVTASTTRVARGPPPRFSTARRVSAQPFISVSPPLRL